MRVSILGPVTLLGLAVSSLATNSHNAIRRPSLPRRLDTEAAAALSNPVAERGILDALWRRYSGRATWYGVGVTMGACGKWTTPSTRAVALNIQLYGNPNAQSAWCGRQLKITKGGRTSIATVVDCCPTCPGNGDLDMSKILFQDFADLNDGIFQMSWSWVGADGGNDNDDDDDDDKGKDDNKGNDNKGGNGGWNWGKDKDDEDEDRPKPKPKPKPKPTRKPKPTATETEEEPEETEKSTKSKSKSTKTKTSSSSTATAEATVEPEEDEKPKKNKSSSHSNLADLGNVIAGFQNLAKLNHA